MDEHMKNLENELAERSRSDKYIQNVNDENLEYRAEPYYPQESKKKGMKLPVVVGVCSMLGIIMIGIAAFLLTTDLRIYSSAKRMMGKGMLMEAAEIFDDLGGYRDAQIRYQDCVYLICQEKYDQDEFEDVLKYLKQIPEYQDERKLYEKSHIQIARKHLNNGNPAEAIQVLEQIPEYFETEQLLGQSRYEYGKMLISAKQYEKALIYLEASDFADSNELMDKAKALMISNAYNGKLYLTPADFRAKINLILSVMQIDNWFERPWADEGESDYIAFLEGDSDWYLPIALEFWGVDHEAGTIEDMMIDIDMDVYDGEYPGDFILAFYVAADLYDDADFIWDEIEDMLLDEEFQKSDFVLKKNEHYIYTAVYKDGIYRFTLSAR